VISSALVAIVAIPMFSLITTGQFALASVATVVMAIAFSGHAAVVHTVLTEMFPTTVRYSAYSIGFSLSTIIFGGSAPLVMTALVQATGDSLIPAYAAVITAIISFVAILFLKETKGLPLRAE
jgi:MHS family proline/betaine transporter-like MFS transporter